MGFHVRRPRRGSCTVDSGRRASWHLHPTKVGIFPDAVEDPKSIDPERAVFENPEFRRSYESV